MKIAVASGKGGTGKTTIAVSLALAASTAKVQLLDCDVEAPNCHIFLKPVVDEEEAVSLDVPAVIEQKCTYCKKCKELCQFNAIAVFGKTIMVFKEMCHSCGGCFLVCPEEAFSRDSREIGTVVTGKGKGGIKFVQGRLRVGEALATPLIKAVRSRALEDGLVILDAPPGTSCPVINTVRGADYTLLVTEPTPFGLHDLKLAAGVLWKLEQPFGVILNRSDLGYGEVEKWCNKNNVPVHLKIPFDRKVAEGYAKGQPLVEIVPNYRDRFAFLLKELTK